MKESLGRLSLPADPQGREHAESRTDTAGRADPPDRSGGGADRRRTRGAVRRAAGTRPRSRCWCGGTGRWSGPPAAASSGTSTTSRTPSRPPSSPWPALPGRSAPGRPSAGWLHRVAMNAAINLKARRRTTGLTADVPARARTRRGTAGAVDEELERLPERMRAAFVLCCLEGMTSAEAARELGLSRSGRSIPDCTPPAPGSGPADPPRVRADRRPGRGDRPKRHGDRTDPFGDARVASRDGPGGRPEQHQPPGDRSTEVHVRFKTQARRGPAVRRAAGRGWPRPPVRATEGCRNARRVRRRTHR